MIMTSDLYHNEPRWGGFTLVETLTVLSLAAVVLSLSIIILNPAARTDAARDAQRWSDLNAIAGALRRGAVDDPESLGVALGVGEREICRSDAGALECLAAGMAVIPQSARSYLAEIPVDPAGSGRIGTGYRLSVGAGAIEVIAPLAESARMPIRVSVVHSLSLDVQESGVQ
jgi:hypothetical protein